jgi:tRNA pseudouridine38-40 synthase
MTHQNPTKHTVEFEECGDNNNRPSKISKIEYDDDDDGEEVEEEEQKQEMNQQRKIQRYLMAIEYIGSRFCGSQKQLTDRTVVGVLEVILLIIDYLIIDCLCLCC